jgi:protein TonB
MMEGNLIYKPQPVYPPMARAARIQGAVILRAIISKAGTIENLQALSGHPLLIPAAIEAVKQWRYRPYVLNGEPVEVETQVAVNFILSGG